MKIRKISLTIAGATMLAGTAATITSAQAATYSREPHSAQWCHKTFGEEQHNLCNYYNWASEAARVLREGNDPQAEDYQFQANEALRRLYAEEKQGI